MNKFREKLLAYLMKTHDIRKLRIPRLILVGFICLTGLACNRNTPSASQVNAPLTDIYYVDGSIGIAYCDTYNPDIRSCSSGNETAYRTIIQAATMVQAGDTVLVQPDTYEGGITVETSGTSDAPITFQALEPGVVIGGSGGERDAFLITYADYIIVDGITIQHADRAGLRIDNSNHVTIRNSTFANNQTWGVFTDFSDNTTIENSESYGSVEEHGIYISNSSDDPTIRGNRLHDNYSCGLHMNGDISMGGDGIISNAIVENNIVYNNDGTILSKYEAMELLKLRCSIISVVTTIPLGTRSRRESSGPRAGHRQDARG